MEDYKMVNAKQIDLTVSGKKELEEELEWRKVSERDRIKEAIKVAREQGDLSENADYTSAREEQSKNEARITEIEDMLKHARIVEVTTIKIAKRHSSRTFWLVLLIIKNGSHLNEPSAKVYKNPISQTRMEKYIFYLCFFMIRQSVYEKHTVIHGDQYLVCLKYQNGTSN